MLKKEFINKYDDGSFNNKDKWGRNNYYSHDFAKARVSVLFSNFFFFF